MEAYERRAEAIFREAGHDFDAIVFSGKEIVPAMERAARWGNIDGIVAGGGDGTISAAASIAWRNGVALGVVPAGTMNLFARSLRVPLDIWQALETLAFGEVDRVDIASANGRPFIHQFSAGLHARMVRYRNSYSYRSRLGKMGASARAAFGVVLNPPEFEVEFEAGGVYERRRVSAVSVSNNPFGQNALLYADSLTGGELGFYTANPKAARRRASGDRSLARQGEGECGRDDHASGRSASALSKAAVKGELRDGWRAASPGARRCVEIASRRTQGIGPARTCSAS